MPNGQITEGNYKRDLMNGFFKVDSEDEHMEGNYEDDMKSGTFLAVKNGQTLEKVYENNQIKSQREADKAAL